MTNDERKLDNPVYHSLTETHENFAIRYNGACFYHPDYCPFGGYTNPDTISEGIDRYSALTANFYVVGEKPSYSKGQTLAKELACHQMVLHTPAAIEISEEITRLVTTRHKNELFDLVNLIQPGYFREKTPELGNYFGIYKDDALIAVTGERMKMHSHTEVSAVVTHPEHTGKGYAKQLTAFTANQIFSEGKIPYLHVADTNAGAIALYEKLGFRTRRKISFWNFIREA